MRRPPPAALAAWLCVGLAALAIGWSLPLDDYWLTIAAGRELLAGADPARAIPLTFTPMLPGIRNPQWGAQLVLASVPVGLGLLLTVGATLAGALITLQRVTRSARGPAPVVAILLGLAVLGPHFLPRVQAFSILLFSVALVLVERYADRRWMPVAYGGLMIAWTNLHGAFVLGIALPFLFLAGRLVDAARTRTIGATLREPPVRILAVAGVTALLVSLINPAGAELVVNALILTAHPIVRAVATEWQPAYPWLPIAAPLWALLVLLIVLRAWRVASGAELVAGVVLLVLALAAIRSIPWFTLMILPLLARAIDRQLAEWPTLERGLGRPGAAFSATRVTRSITLFAAVLLAFQLVRPALPPALARLTLEEPVALVDVLERQLPDDAPARVFNEQSWGGYLVYRLGDRVRTYLDGRLDTAPAEVWRGYYAILTGPDGVRRMDDLGVDWVLLRTEHGDLLRDLRSRGYEPIAADATGELLRAPDD